MGKILAYYNDFRLLKAKVFRADYTLRAVLLEKGKHEVVFRYEPASYRMRRFISINAFIGVVAWAAIFAIRFINRRKMQS